VVTHPGAILHSAPGESEQKFQNRIKPFTVYYVYERATRMGSNWLMVGSSSNCKIVGWVKKNMVSDWRHSLTLIFTERTGRQPVLFFKDMQPLWEVAASPSPGDAATKMASEFVAIKEGRVNRRSDFPILAMEPPEEAISKDRFYLMPIFDTAELFEGVKFLKLASIDPGTWQMPEDLDLRTGIVFVVDTTISMKKYIDRTSMAVRKIYEAVDSAGLSDKVAFGLVAYRNSSERTPALGYTSKVISDLRDGRQRAAFELALTSAEEANASSHSFNEEAFAGLKMALEELNWGPYLSRLIFLITDAGAIRNDDPYSATGMNEKGIADLAAAKGVKIFALHLKTPSGARFNNHAFAEGQYRTLTGHSDETIGDLYVPIDATQPETGVQGFGRVIEGVATKMVELVRATAAGERLSLPDQLSSPQADIVADVERKAAILGYAMQLDFLGRRGRVQAPKVVTSWVSDMDLVRPDIPSFQVTVMLTKNQLSDLHQRLKVILDQAQRTKRTGARDFFQSILSAAAQTSRDPAQLGKKSNQALGQLGILAEFLDGLPYLSSIMRLKEEDWYRLSIGEQQAIVDDLKSKIKRYQQYHDDVENWVGFGETDPGDMVYRVPLNMMP
jgi:serine/threonine-protein kinase PpkA